MTTVRVPFFPTVCLLALSAALGLPSCGDTPLVEKPRQEGWVPGLEGAWSSPHPAGPMEAMLGSIGYGGGDEQPRNTGGVWVLRRDQALAAPRLYTSGHGPEAILISVAGDELHRWRCDWRELKGVPALDGPTQNTFRRALLLPKGDLLAVYGGRGLVRMNKNGEPRWVYPERAHHDLTLDDQGQLWTLIREERIETRLGHSGPVVDDLIVQLDLETGEEISRTSVLDALLRGSAAKILRIARTTKGDFMHTNTLVILTTETAALHSSWKAGQALICIRELDALAVIDLHSGAAVWTRTGVGVGPHEPEITSAGTLLLFDNHGNRGASIVREFSLPAFDPTVIYEGQPPNQFFSRFCGAAHRLSNGNTLVVESNRGRVFELDSKGQRVWQFENPKRTGTDGRWIAAVFDMVPVDGSSAAGNLDWLAP